MKIPLTPFLHRFQWTVCPRKNLSPKRSECDLVAIDNVSAGRRVAEHLIARGYRRIAFLMQGGAFRSNINWRNRFFGVAGESALRGIAEAVTPLYFEPGDIARLRRLCRSRFRPQAIALER